MLTKTHLNLISLEDRTQPATFGIPWADSSISLSFAPDGTQIEGRNSDLFSKLNSSRSENEWKQDILMAFYTWSKEANFDIAVTPDSGNAFGTPGRTQNDPRFGDIRIGGNSLASNVLAFASPPDPALSGTLSGDVFLNTNYEFQGRPYDLNRVVLHEAGHALGLDHSTNKNSPMYPRFFNTSSGLTSSDAEAIRKLYGPRMSDRHEGTLGNATINTASQIAVPSNYTGETPLLTYANLTSTSDTDIFWFETVSGYGDDDTVSVHFQSEGISLLGAEITVYSLDSSGQPQEVANVESDSADFTGDSMTLTFDGNDDHDDSAQRFFIRVRKSDSAPFSIGRYALAVSFEGQTTIPPANLQQVMLCSYQNLGPNDLAALLQDPNRTLVNLDRASNDSVGSATPLMPTFAYRGSKRFEAIGSLGTPNDMDYYRVTAPINGSLKVLTINAWALNNQNLSLKVALFDSNGLPISSQIFVNNGQSFTIQTGNLSPGATYLLGVSSSNQDIGNYFLAADFGSKATVIQTLANGELTPTSASRTDTLYIAQTQMFHFILSSESSQFQPEATVKMTIVDATGQVVWDLWNPIGETVTGSSVLLRPGQYFVRFEIMASAAPVTFSLKGNRITDPIGPVLDDPTLEPVYSHPINPFLYSYPGDIESINPYYWFWA